MRIISQRILSSRRTERALWASLLFSLVGGLSACSSTAPGEGSVDSAETTTVSDGMTQSESEASTAESSASNSTPIVDQRFGTRRAPEVKEQPFKSGDQWMNAFYFVRSPSETWENLGQMIYGRSDRGDILAGWNNQGTLAVGRVIYYNSAARPTDQTSIKVFAEDFGFGLQQVEVKAGDSLSQIAQSLYGSPQSWKEIAALNPELSNPDSLQVGQKLVIQPVQMDTKAAINQIASSSSSSSNEAEAAATTTDSSSAALPPAGEADPELKALDSEPEAVAQTESSDESSPSSNLFIMIGGGAIVIGLIALLLWRRRLAKQNKALSPNGAWDENGNVTKLTRPKTGF